MSEPISAIVKTARTPEQAKLFVATLKAAGIPAFTDGVLQDEFAMSQRMMNLISVKVMVPSDALERAKEVLTKYAEEGAKVDLDELTRQALEAGNPDGLPIGADPDGLPIGADPDGLPISE
jgi:hypothetical protein